MLVGEEQAESVSGRNEDWVMEIKKCLRRPPVRLSEFVSGAARFLSFAASHPCASGQNRSAKGVIAIVIIVASILTTAPPVRAQSTLIWTNGSDFWQSYSAWTTNTYGGTGGFPGMGDNAFFTNAATYSVVLSNDVLNIQSNFFSNASNTLATTTLDLGAYALSLVYTGNLPGAFLVGDGANSTTIVYLASSTVSGKGLVVPGRIVVGRNGIGTLVVTNGNVLVGQTILGNATGGRGTLVLSGTNTVWMNTNTFAVGNNSNSFGNSLVISNSASMTVTSSFRLGSSSGQGGCSNNMLVLDSNGRLFTHSGPVTIGHRSSAAAPSYNNTATVQGGAVWDNGNVSFVIGSADGGAATGNVLRIMAGSAVTNISLLTITADNTLDLQGGRIDASTTTNYGTIQGFGTISGSVIDFGLLSPTNGALLATNVVVGWPAVAEGTLTVASGSLVVTNAVGTGSIDLQWGSMLINGGAVIVNSLTATNGTNSIISFNGGTLTSGGTTVSNSSGFAIGDSGSGATFVARGGTHSFANNVWVGNSGGGNRLVINNGAQMANDWACLAYGSTSSNNSVLVSGTGSVWSNRSSLYLGYDGVGNTLVITNGGVVYGSFACLGYGIPSGNNAMLVTGSGSVLRDPSSSVYVGYQGASNTLTIANGGAVYTYSGLLGYHPSSSNNAVVVTDTGSVWSNLSDNLYVGNYGAGNTLTITNGGVVYNKHNGSLGYLASGSNNAVVVTGSGSVWQIGGTLYVGSRGSSNVLTIVDGSVVASNAFVGYSVSGSGIASNNVLRVNSGSLFVTNATGDGALVVSRWGGEGRLIVNGGSVTVDSLIATNGANSVIAFNGGTLNSGGTYVTNSQTFAVGDGSSMATFHLAGGVHAFANDLQIRTNAFLTGCGTITGNALVEGTVLADCGTTLDFGGTVINNGIVIATGGTVLNFYGAVVNNSLIDNTSGNIQFFSTLSGSGLMITPTNSWTDGSGKWETATNWSQATAPSISDAANLITNAGNNTVTIDSITAGLYSGTMAIRNLTVSSPGGATNTLLLDNTGTLTPLQTLGVVILETNGAVIVNRSALQATNLTSAIHVGGSGSGNSLVISNGGVVHDAYGYMGSSPLAGGNSALVADPGSVWSNRYDLIVGQYGSGNSLVISNGGRVNDEWGYMGWSFGGSNNSVLVTDTGSVWSNSSGLAVGWYDSGNSLVITNSGVVVNNYGFVGYSSTASNNSVRVADGAVWSNNVLYIGYVGSSNQLTVAGGSVFATNLTIGFTSPAANNLIQLESGHLIVTNDSGTATVVVNGGSLVIGAGLFKTDNLVVTNSGAVQYIETYLVDNGSITVANGTLQAGSNLVVGTTASSTGSVAVTGGELVVTNGVLGIGNDGTITSGSGVGTMAVSNGTVTVSSILLGSTAGGQGHLILGEGGLINSVGTNADLIVNGFDQIGGGLVWTNGTMYCGYRNPGAYTLSNGVSDCLDVYVGYDNVGSMTVAGGTMSVCSRLTVGHLGPPFAGGVSTGAVWITGGQLTMNNLPVIIGNCGVGQFSISNGSVQAATVVVGNGNNSGTLTLAGGTLTVTSLLITNPNSRFVFSGGWLNVQAITDANGQAETAGNGVTPATLKLSGGNYSLDRGLTISANTTLTGYGTVMGDVVNNGTIRPGDGTLIFTGLVTNNGLMITNSSMQFLGGLVNNGTILDAAGDADGDGMNNLWEVLAGTDPTDSDSVFRIIGITRTGNDVQVTWSAVGGKQYVLQAAPGAGGSYSNDFTDLSSTISVLGSGESVTNSLDPGGASTPARYYRVRLGP